VLTILKHTHDKPLHTSMERADNSALENSELDGSGVEDSGAEKAIAENFAGDSTAAKDASDYQPEDPALSEGTRVATGRGIDPLTWILGAAVLAFALLLTVLTGERLFREKTASRAHPHAEHNSATVASGTTEAGANGAPGTKTESAKTSDTSTSRSASMAPGTGTSHATYSPPPVGGLLVLEKGKEIFRMPAAPEQGDRRNLLGTNRTGSAGTAETADRPASGVEQAAIYELSPEAASGSLLHRVEPDYPQEALQRHIQGPVALDVRIARNGAIQEVKLVAGERLLADAAIAAVKQWQFKPHLIKGQPVEMQTRVTLNFRLPR
jgi:TonB family protein